VYRVDDLRFELTLQVPPHFGKGYQLMLQPPLLHCLRDGFGCSFPRRETLFVEAEASISGNPTISAVEVHFTVAGVWSWRAMWGPRLSITEISLLADDGKVLGRARPLVQSSTALNARW